MKTFLTKISPRETASQPAIALVLALILMISVIPINIAHATPYPGAEMLKKHGFIHGNEKGDLLVESYFTRAQACVLMAELFGERKEADNYKYNNEFDDVSAKDWFAPYVGYAKKRGWIQGTTPRTFKPKDDISAQSWAVLLLRALDYDDNWNHALANLDDIGIKIYSMNPAKIKRGEAFDAMWSAVNKNPKGKDQSLGVIVGRIEAPQKDPEIKTISTPSLRIVNVQISPQGAKLNKEKAENPANYSITSEGGKDLEIQKVTYNQSENQNEISILLAQPAIDGAELVLNARALSATGATQSFTVQDSIPPKLVSIESLGTRAFKINFSEPVKSISKSDLTYDKTGVRTKNLHLAPDHQSAIVELASPTTDRLVVKFSQNIKDYFGFSLTVSSFAVQMSADMTAIKVVSSRELSPVGVTLIFNKELSFVRSTANTFRHYGSYSDGNPTINGRELRIHFTRNYLRPGKNIISIDDKALMDYSGNFSQAMDFNLEIPADSEPPYTKEIKVVAPNKLRVFFNEGLDTKGKLLHTSSYKLYELTQKSEVELKGMVSGVTFSTKGKYLEINFAKELKGNYRLVSTEIRDYAGNVGSGDFSFTVEDMTPPDSEKWIARVYNSGRSDQLLKIRFDEPMATSGKYSVLDLENYKINGKQLDQLDANLMRVELTDDDSSLEIHYPGTKVAGGYDFNTGSTSKIIIGRLADRAGNYTAKYSSSLTLNGAGSMRIERAEQISAESIKVSMFDKLEQIDLSDFIIESGGESQSIEEITSEGSELNIKVRGNLKMPATIRTVKGGSVNRFGETFANSSALKIIDKVGPVLEHANLSGNSRDYVTYSKSSGKIILHFTEPIDARTVSLLTFEIPGIRIQDISASGSNITIRVDHADRHLVQLDTQIFQKVQIHDLSGNATSNILTTVGLSN